MQKFNRGSGNKFGNSNRQFGDRDKRSGGDRQFGNGRFERKSFGDRGKFGGGNTVTMHPAVCSQCGQACEVPFRPSGDKPVFCNDCFKGNNRSEVKKFEERKPANNDNRQFDDKLDKIIYKLDEIVRALKNTAVPEIIPAAETLKPAGKAKAVKIAKAGKTAKKEIKRKK